MKENRGNIIPDNLQNALLQEYQTIKNQCSHIYVSAHHEWWRQQYQQLEQYRQQVIDLVGERRADDILLSLYFGGRVSKRKRFFSLPHFHISERPGKTSLNRYIDTLKRAIGEALARLAERMIWGRTRKRMQRTRNSPTKKPLPLPLHQRNGEKLSASLPLTGDSARRYAILAHDWSGSTVSSGD
jgi:hypothetical protein